MNLQFRYALILLIAIAMIAGCGQSEPTELPEPTAGLDSPLAPSSPLNPPQESLAPDEDFQPTPLPPPGPSKGSITGRIINSATGKGVVGTTVYLGTVSAMGSEGGNIVTMKEKASPHTLTSLGGYFALTDVEPDTYALILWTPLNSIVVPDPDTGRELLITIEENRIIDLGEVVSPLP